MLTPEYLEQRRLPRAVRAEQEAARSGRELEVHALDEGLLTVDGGAVDVRVGPVQVVDVDAPHLRGVGGCLANRRGRRRVCRGGNGLGISGGSRASRCLLRLSLGECRERTGGLHHRGGGVDAAAGVALPTRHRDRYGHVRMIESVVSWAVAEHGALTSEAARGAEEICTLFYRLFRDVAGSHRRIRFVSRVAPRSYGEQSETLTINDVE